MVYLASAALLSAQEHKRSALSGRMINAEFH
jgi:hypothetical protein